MFFISKVSELDDNMSINEAFSFFMNIIEAVNAEMIMNISITVNVNVIII